MADTSADETPVRSFMDDPNIKWRHGKPNYAKVNKRYLAEKTMKHKPGSLEKTVEDLVKTWEMESSHKGDLKDWGTIDREKFKVRTNGGRWMDGDDNIEFGNYNMFMEDSPLYDRTKETHDSSHEIFRTAFETFPWEVLEVFSGPPRVAFTWRHWTEWTGPYKDVKPTGESIELLGFTVVTVNSDLKIELMEVYYDPNPLLMKLQGKCPFYKPEK